MLSSCVESASEEKSTEISVGQQDRGTLVFVFSFFFPPNSSAIEIPVYFCLLEQSAAN